MYNHATSLHPHCKSSTGCTTPSPAASLSCRGLRETLQVAYTHAYTCACTHKHKYTHAHAHLDAVLLFICLFCSTHKPIPRVIPGHGCIHIELEHTDGYKGECYEYTPGEEREGGGPREGGGSTCIHVTTKYMYA